MIAIFFIGLLIPLSVLTLPSPRGLWIWRPTTLVAIFSFASLLAGQSLYDLNTLSLTTLILFVGGGYVFFLGDLISTFINGRLLTASHATQSTLRLGMRRAVACFLTLCAVTGFVIAAYLLVTRGLLSGDAIGYALRYAHMYGEESDYGAFHFLLAAQVFGTYLLLSPSSQRRKMGWLLLGMCLFGSIVKMERTSILMLLSSAAFLIHYRTRRIGILLYPALAAALLFYIVAEATFKADTVVGNFFLAYLGYGLKAFDQHVLAMPGIDGGTNVFPWVFKIFGQQVEGADVGVAAGDFNVYSYIEAPYMDFGLVGAMVVIFSFAVVWGWMFNGIRTSPFKVLMYSAMVYPAVVVFYSWQFSLTTYFYLAFLYCMVLTVGSKTGGTKSLRFFPAKGAVT